MRYVWDADKKELKKIDARENLTLDGDLMQADSMMVESSWSEKDEEMIQIIKRQLGGTLGGITLPMTCWFNSLKDRIK